jgi:hypothetical protein
MQWAVVVGRQSHRRFLTWCAPSRSTQTEAQTMVLAIIIGFITIIMSAVAPQSSGA